jgi:hypothetical protein
MAMTKTKRSVRVRHGAATQQSAASSCSITNRSDTIPTEKWTEIQNAGGKE